MVGVCSQAAALVLVALAPAFVSALPMPSAQAPAHATTISANADATRVAAKRKKKRKGGDAPAGDTPIESPVAPAPALPTPPALPQGKRAVAVLPIEGLDVTPEMVRSIEIALLREIEEIGGLEGVTPQDVVNDLQKFGLSPQCDGDMECLARAGRYARSHLSLETRVAALGGTISISLRLVDTQTGKEVGRVADPISEQDEARAEELHRMAIQLFLPETYVGSLAINVAVGGAEVYLDDKLIGTTPLPGPLENLRAGPHILRITKAGFSDLYRFVDVVYKRASTIEVDLSNTTIAGTIVEEVSKTGFGALFVATNVADVEIRIEGEPKGVTPLEGPIEKVPAGKRRLSLRKEGVEAFTQEIEIVAKQRTDLRVKLEGNTLITEVLGSVAPDAALPATEVIAAMAATGPGPGLSTTAPPPVEWSPGWKTWSGVVALGLGAGGLIAGGVFGSEVLRLTDEAQQLKNDLEGGVANQTISVEQGERMLREIDNKNSQGWAMQDAQFISYAVGGGLMLVGGLLVLWDLLSDPSPPAATTDTTVGAEATGVTWQVGGGPSGGWLRVDF